MKLYTDQVLSAVTGLSLIGASVTVKLAGTQILATLYAVDSLASNPIANPFSSNTGVFQFYAPDGRYDILVRVGGRTRLLPNVDIVDLIELVRRLEGVENGEPNVPGSLRNDLLLDGGANRVAHAGDKVSDLLDDFTSNWPSAIQNVPRVWRAGILDGTNTHDLSDLLFELADQCDQFTLGAGVFLFRGDRLELNREGQKFYGRAGILKRVPGINGLGLLISKPGCEISGLNMDASAAQPAAYHINDAIRVNAGGTIIDQTNINGTRGGGIAILGVGGCTVSRTKVRYARDNGFFAASLGQTSGDVQIVDQFADDNWFIECVSQFTEAQNGFFVTSNAGSGRAEGFTSGTLFLNCLSEDAGDTGFESGIRTRGTRMINCISRRSHAPGFLARDSFRVLMSGCRSEGKPLAQQSAEYDAFAVVPQWDSAKWSSQARIIDPEVVGQCTRSGIYVGQSDVRIRSIEAQAYGNAVVPMDGIGLVGSGIIHGGTTSDPVSGVVVEGGHIDGYAIGENWNYAAIPMTRKDCHTRGLEVTRCRQVQNFFQITPVRCSWDGLGHTIATLESKLAGMTLAPNVANPDIGMRYSSSFDLRGEWNTNPSRFDPPDLGLQLLGPDSQWFIIGAQFAPTTLVSPSRPGLYTARLASGARDITFVVSPSAGKVAKLIGTDDGTSTSGPDDTNSNGFGLRFLHTAGMLQMKDFGYAAGNLLTGQSVMVTGPGLIRR